MFILAIATSQDILFKEFDSFDDAFTYALDDLVDEGRFSEWDMSNFLTPKERELIKDDEDLANKYAWSKIRNAFRKNGFFDSFDYLCKKELENVYYQRFVGREESFEIYKNHILISCPDPEYMVQWKIKEI